MIRPTFNNDVEERRVAGTNALVNAGALARDKRHSREDLRVENILRNNIIAVVSGRKFLLKC